MYCSQKKMLTGLLFFSSFLYKQSFKLLIFKIPKYQDVCGLCPNRLFNPQQSWKFLQILKGSSAA
jgi:hypothetical protein